MAVEEEDDESLADLTLEEFKERYRRLIPYMTFYAANNYLGQTPVSQSSSKDIQSSPLIRKPQPIIRISNVPRKGINRINAPNYDKFVPSVQYDPQKLGSDTEYFMPVRYSSKAGHEDHVQPQVYQEQKVTYSDLTATPSPIARKENRYYANVRPVRPYTTNGRDQLPRKQAKPILGSIRDDYLLDYSLRPANTRVNYPIKDLQGHRHLPVYSNLQPLDPVAAKQPLLPQPPRNPHVNLDRSNTRELPPERAPAGDAEQGQHRQQLKNAGGDTQHPPQHQEGRVPPAALADAINNAEVAAEAAKRQDKAAEAEGHHRNAVPSDTQSPVPDR